MNNPPNIAEKEMQELRKRVQVLERELLSAQAVNIASSSLARLASDNPNPVLRVTSEGTVLYSNAAAVRLWKCQINELLPVPLRLLVFPFQSLLMIFFLASWSIRYMLHG